jgi:PKD repeat protein
MKKIIVFVLCLFCLNNVLYGQCTPDIGITDPGIYPDTIENLPVAFQNAFYSTTMQLKVLTDTLVPGLGLVTVTNIQVLSVVGMPPGINYQCYQNNCTFPGGSNRCVQISGTATTAGVYPIVVNVKLNGIYGGFIPVSQNSTITGYTIVVLAAPVTNFSAAPTVLCPGGTVTFTDASTNMASSWNWTFNGGTPATSTEKNPVVTYSTAGQYAVTHSATNPAGTNSITKTNFITVNAAPPGNIQMISNDSVCRGDTLKMIANSSPGATYQWYKSLTIIPGATSPYFSSTTSGYFRCIVTAANGCTKAVGPKITKIVNLPNATITAAGPTTFCQGQSVVLNANTDIGLTYQWKKFSTDIVNATLPSYTATQGGVYKVITRNAFGCGRTSNTIQVTISCREGIFAAGNSLQLNPNPAQDFTTLEFFASTDNAMIAIYDITGKLVSTFNVSTLPNTTASLNIPTAHIPNGVYMIQVDDGNNKRTVRLMVR